MFFNKAMHSSYIKHSTIQQGSCTFSYQWLFIYRFANYNDQHRWIRFWKILCEENSVLCQFFSILDIYGFIISTSVKDQCFLLMKIFYKYLKKKKTVDMCNDFGVLCNLTYISTYVRICFTDHISHTVAAAHNPFFIGVFLRTSVNLGRSFQMQYLAC